MVQRQAECAIHRLLNNVYRFIEHDCSRAALLERSKYRISFLPGGKAYTNIVVTRARLRDLDIAHAEILRTFATVAINSCANLSVTS